MNLSLSRLRNSPFEVVLIAALLAAIYFLLLGHIGLDLADEGYLWYGTIQTALGEVPLRDFQSYEPGRYYWGALWFKILGNSGIITLRISQAIFLFIGLTCGLLTLRRVLKRWWALAACGLLLTLWVIFPFKVYDQVIIMCAVYVAVLLIERPSVRRHFAAGIFVGVAAFFGRNHGMYCTVAFLALIFFIWWKIDRGNILARLSMWGAGVVVGYSPMLLMFAFVPGFFTGVINGILFNLRVGTNLPLPVPWPWVPDYAQMSWRGDVQAFFVGVLYLVMPLFYLCVGAYLLLSKREVKQKALLIACTFIGVAYLHHTFDRAHMYYLVWTIHPLLIGLIALPYSFAARFKRWLVIAVWAFIIVSTWAVIWMWQWNYYPASLKAFVKTHVVSRYKGNYDLAFKDYRLLRINAAGDDLWVNEDSAPFVNSIVNTINRQNIAPDESILLVPYLTTFYPLLQKHSPLWEIYFLFPQEKSTQAKMIDDLNRNNTNWVLRWDTYLDRRQDLRFELTHPDLWQYIKENFEPVEAEGLPVDFQLLHRKGSPAKINETPKTETPKQNPSGV